MTERPLIQLVLVRIREFTREPEAVFWALLFPIILSTGLGLAFSNRPAPVVKIGADPVLVERLRSEHELDVRPLSADAARLALRNGEIALVVEATAGGGVAFLYDDTNPDGRSARALADRALQRTGGRVDPVSTRDELIR